MKKIALLVIALFVAKFTFAQKGIEVGVNFTPATTWMLNDDDFAEGDNLNFRATFGMNAGLTVGYNFTDAIGITTGLLYSQQGQNYVDERDATKLLFENGRESNMTNTYLRVPVLLRVSTGELSKEVGGYFRVGPHFDFLTTSKYTNQTLTLTGDVEDEVTNIRELENDFDADFVTNTVIGVTMELGSKIRLSDNMGIVMALHLSGSMTDPEGKDAKDGMGPNGDDRAKTWSTTGGITLGFNYVIGL